MDGSPGRRQHSPSQSSGQGSWLQDPPCIPRLVFRTAKGLVKLKNPRLGFVVTVGSTGTSLKTLMGTFVSWTSQVLAEGSRSTEPQVSAVQGRALESSPLPPLCQTTSATGETAAEEKAQNQHLAMKSAAARLKLPQNQSLHRNSQASFAGSLLLIRPEKS